MQRTHVARLRPIALAAAVLVLAAVTAGRSHAQAHAVASQRDGLPPAQQLRVQVNSVDAGTWPVLDAQGVLYLPVEAFSAWGARSRGLAETIETQGRMWRALSSIAGFEGRLNLTAGTLALIIPGARVDALRLTAAVALSSPPQAAAQAVTGAALPAAPSPAPVPVPAASGGTAQAQLAGGRQAPAPTGAAASPEERLLPLEVNVNSSSGGQWALLERDGVLYAPEEAFEEWRVRRRPDVQPLQARGQVWYPLSSVPGFQARFNQANQSMDLVFSPTAFAATRLSRDSAEPLALTPALNTVFANYDLNYSQTHLRGVQPSGDLGLVTELGVSGSWGVLTSSHVGRNLAAQFPGNDASWRRLETSFVRDFPGRDLTLRVGDGSTRAGAFGAAMYFGGLQLTRNFGLRPGFLTQPVPSLTGSASAPSTVELYINDSLRQVSTVPTGPFTIDNFPLLTGGGEARVVVRDVLGRETVLVQPFFTHGELLEQGLTDWSVELGKARRNIGSVNADYGTTFIAGLWRTGLSKTLTLEANSQLSQNLTRLSFGASQTLPFQALGQAGLSMSQSDRFGQGYKLSFGAERNALAHGFGAQIDHASDAYRELGWEDTLLANRWVLSGNYSYSAGAARSFGLGAAMVDSQTQGRLGSVSANYSLRLGERSALTLTATRVFGPTSGVSVGLALLVPLDGGIITSASATRRSGQLDAYASASKPSTSEIGAGWRVLAGTRGSQAYSEGGYYYQGSRGLLSADVSASSDQQTLRLGAQGGAALADGRLFASRRMQDSFAIVEVAGFPDVGIGLQGGSVLTRTDADGVAVLPRLLPYQSNSIRIDARELPISAEIDNLEQVAVPAARTGVKVVFPVRTGRAALLRIVFDDGEPAPAGAILVPRDTDKEFYVARRGEAFVTGLRESDTVELRWKGAACRIVVDLPAEQANDIARVGPLACRGVAR